MKKVYKIDMVFNRSCMGGQQLIPEGYRVIIWYLDRLNDIEIDFPYYGRSLSHRNDCP
jgi:hypothetical protein